jgi:hypothetical protein
LAESELGVLASQCLDRRIPDKQTITDEVAAWVRERNKNHAAAEWRFTTNDARIKLNSLYPSLGSNRATRADRKLTPRAQRRPRRRDLIPQNRTPSALILK